MKLLIVASSHRPNSQSLKVARFTENTVKVHVNGFDSVEVIDLAELDLPFWTEDTNNKGSAIHPNEWATTSNELYNADAFVFVVPEWGGMPPAKLKNLFTLCDKHQLAHKPALLIGISSGYGGSYPLSELRATSSKDTHICYIPESVVVRTVTKCLNNKEPQDRADEAIHQRIIYSANVLQSYATALADVRTSGAIDLQRFPYGM